MERHEPGPASVAPRRIVHVIGTLGAGGVQSLILGMTARPPLARFRHAVVCVFRPEGDLARRFEDAGIPVLQCHVPWPARLPIPSYRASRWLRHRMAFTFPRRLARVLGGLGADLVHSHLAHRIDLQALAALRIGRPLVWTIHGAYNPEGRELRRWALAARRIRQSSGAITAVSSSLAADFHARGLEFGPGVRVIHGGVDLSRFRAPRRRDPAWRERFGIGPDAIVVGSVGRLVPEKDYGVLVRAVAILAREGAPVEGVIAGEGPERERIAAEIARAGIGHRFRLLGFEADVPGFLRQLDIFALSSRSEGFPIALVEALACGVASVATDVGGVSAMLGPDGGRVVPPESDKALASALRDCLDPSVRAGFASRGPALAEHYSIDRHAEQLGRLYDQILHGPAAATANGRSAASSARKVSLS